MLQITGFNQAGWKEKSRLMGRHQDSRRVWCERTILRLQNEVYIPKWGLASVYCWESNNSPPYSEGGKDDRDTMLLSPVRSWHSYEMRSYGSTLLPTCLEVLIETQQDPPVPTCMSPAGGNKAILTFPLGSGNKCGWTRPWRFLPSVCFMWEMELFKLLPVPEHPQWSRVTQPLGSLHRI